ncbi:hypothetical protein BLA24_21870 [Streptomyces cinnamoneus]|uniref:Cupin domain-containing protein n=1 Tax=Streptomyces cinnamoneus TaxID=53446 RepID=A0A2G1XG49_STRCJ|nr:hypothetical protein [Streptomyces cinnamoneus]PHQ50220.1 hypothetical protein BLA24_21870 [Streptomyces cinnamoneus]PPT12996.1 hypothetical protein CYQ11_08915 [Streptomyces cinnamoneus]
MTSTTREQTPVTVEGEGLEVRTQDIGGGMSVMFMRAAAGTDLGPALKGLPDDLCQCPHWGFLAKGRVRIRTKDGEEMYESGQAFYWGPGHAPSMVEDTEFVDFSPTEKVNEVVSHVKAQMG